ncbi:MAG: hypothetical protein K8T90_02250 [Planctomycetes bacterium]|nr:hypothetical protein [Planctomycetota bacterium]
MLNATKILILTAAALLSAATTTNALAGDHAKQGRAPAVGKHARGGRGHARGDRGGLRERFGKMRHRRQAVVQALAFTPDQQRMALEKARAAAPIVAEARKELAQVLVKAQAETATGTPEVKPDRETRKAAHAQHREAVRELRKRTAEKLAPLAKDLVASLTPEQRTKLEGMAAARGHKLDDAKLVKVVTRWIARPMTADVLEAKLGTR